MLKERKKEIRGSMPDDDNLVLRPTMEEIVWLYELLLSDLTVNSKTIITDLTIVAGEQREHGEGIANAFCGRILKVVLYSTMFSLGFLECCFWLIYLNSTIFVLYWSFRMNFIVSRFVNRFLCICVE